MPKPEPPTPAEFERLKARIAENVRAELARAVIPHTALPDMLGLHRDVAARRWRGDTAYFAYEIALLAAVLDIPAARLMNCDLEPGGLPLPVYDPDVAR